MFKEERSEALFDWNMIGDIDSGRPNLGPTMNVAVYRLMQFTLRDVLIREYGTEAADRIFYESGWLAGREFCKEFVDRDNDFDGFIEQVQELLMTLKVGIMRIEKADMDRMRFTLTVAEDLDCSGLPECDETICTYDEGFLHGLFTEYTGKEFDVKEIDCWCSGDRVCRFRVEPAQKE